MKITIINDSFELQSPSYHEIELPRELELPPNITIPAPNAPEVISELHESEKNKTNLLQWLLGLAGISQTTTPIPVPDPAPTSCPTCRK